MEFNVSSKLPGLSGVGALRTTHPFKLRALTPRRMLAQKLAGFGAAGKFGPKQIKFGGSK
jgi:hypothetical protein